jgi:2-dehydro-3-deoxyphosphogluconate aldolase/(4S)-4-hydroxy-2-oxoglutarate aldolase
MSTAPAIARVMDAAPVIPVLVVHELAHARPIAEALVEGGLPVLEVTLRTPVALDVIREMAKVPGAIVGAGTVVDAAGVAAARDAGAQFLVSPGLTERLARAAADSGLPFLPGVATAGDIIRGLELGLTHFKFFPATAAGGIPALKALAAPFYQCAFCPTGGITAETAADWLALPAVRCVGGSWMVGSGPLDTGVVRDNARRAASMGEGRRGQGRG